MVRAVKPGGRVVCLEVARPQTRIARLAQAWFDRIVPVIGRVAGQGSAYSYLVSSTQDYPDPTRIAAIMREVGLVEVSWQPMTMGIVTLHVGRRPDLRVTRAVQPSDGHQLARLRGATGRKPSDSGGSGRASPGSAPARCGRTGCTSPGTPRGSGRCSPGRGRTCAQWDSGRKSSAGTSSSSARASMRPTSKSSSASPSATMTRGSARMSTTFSACGLLTTRIAAPSQLNQSGIRPGKPSVPKVDSQSTSSVRRNCSMRSGCRPSVRVHAPHGAGTHRRGTGTIDWSRHATDDVASATMLDAVLLGSHRRRLAGARRAHRIHAAARRPRCWASCSPSARACSSAPWPTSWSRKRSSTVSARPSSRSASRWGRWCSTSAAWPLRAPAVPARGHEWGRHRPGRRPRRHPGIGRARPVARGRCRCQRAIPGRGVHLQRAGVAGRLGGPAPGRHEPDPRPHRSGSAS